MAQLVAQSKPFGYGQPSGARLHRFWSTHEVKLGTKRQPVDSGVLDPELVTNPPLDADAPVDFDPGSHRATLRAPLHLTQHSRGRPQLEQPK